MQSYNPAIPVYTVSRLLNVVSKNVNKKSADKPLFLWLMLFYTQSLLLLQASVLWHSIVTFNNDAKWPSPKWIYRQFSVANPAPAKRVSPPWHVYMAKFDPGWEGYPVLQTGLPA